MLSPRIDFIDLLNTKETMLRKISLPHTLCEVNLTLEKLTLASVRNLGLKVTYQCRRARKSTSEFSSESQRYNSRGLARVKFQLNWGNFWQMTFALMLVSIN